MKKLPLRNDSIMNDLMSRMISCVINYPSLVNNPESSSVIEERAKRLPKSDVLVELIRFAQVEADLTKEALLMPYKAKPRIYSRLEELSVLEPFLSEYEAKQEFSYALTTAEKYYERKSTKASITSAKTHEEQKKVMAKIMGGEPDIQTLKKENENLKKQLEAEHNAREAEYNARIRDFVSKDEVKSESNNWLFVVGFMVFLVIAYASLD